MKNPFYQNVKFEKSLKHAFNGLNLIVKNERNFRIILVFSVFVITAGFIFRITHFEWVAITIVIALVFVSETINSVIEAICDTVSHDFKVNIKYAKDVSAGAVLVSSLVSIVAGLLIFVPYIVNLLLIYIK